MDFSIARIARYKVPKHVFFIEEFPLTASGKIQKFKLKEMAVDCLDIKTAKEEKID